jgi:hypothetical protein
MSGLMKVFIAAGAALGAVVLTAGALVAQQTGMRRMGPGGMQDPDHMKDMQVFHQLIEQRDRITRTVTVIDKGVDTLTESDDPTVAGLIRAHVAAMTARVEQARPIHMRDPLFRAVFANADRIEMKSTATANGVRVVETSTDPYVAKLIQAHAEVVSAFLKNGFEEMHKNHDVPPR